MGSVTAFKKHEGFLYTLVLISVQEDDKAEYA